MKNTALDSLKAARQQAMTQWHIISLAAIYAEDNPEWFASWTHAMFEHQALCDAAFKADSAGDTVAFLVLQAAAELVFTDLFGGGCYDCTEPA